MYYVPFKNLFYWPVVKNYFLQDSKSSPSSSEKLFKLYIKVSQIFSEIFF